MKDHITININYDVRFKLTPAGESHLEKVNNTWPQFAQYPMEYQKDERGYCRESLWQLMSIFGEAIYMGGPFIFENNNLFLPEEELE